MYLGPMEFTGWTGLKSPNIALVWLYGQHRRGPAVIGTAGTSFSGSQRVEVSFAGRDENRESHNCVSPPVTFTLLKGNTEHIRV